MRLSSKEEESLRTLSSDFKIIKVPVCKPGQAFIYNCISLNRVMGLHKLSEVITMSIEIVSRRLSAVEYIEFLKRTDLGSQYPKERFEERIGRLVKNTSISLPAMDGKKIVGIIFGLTDFAYWLYITDLGVDREYEGRGIGTMLMKKAHEAAGSEKDIAVYLIANDNAIPFYEKYGMKKARDVMEYNHIEWTYFKVE